MQLFKDDGTPWAGAKQLPIGAKGRIVISDPKFFVDPGSNLVQGYVTVASDGPRLLGSVFFGDPNLQSFGTTLPLVSTLLNRIIFAQLASDATWYTGIALLNPNSVQANAVISVYDPSGGTPKYTKTQVLPAGQRTVGVLTDFFPALKGVSLSSGFITVVSDQPLAGFALYGTKLTVDLAAVPAQKMP